MYRGTLNIIVYYRIIAMLIQLVNIISGFVLAAPKLKALAGNKVAHVEKAESTLNAFRGFIGIAAFILGVCALLGRLGIVFFGMFLLGSSFPQGISAVLCGLLLAPHLFANVPAIVDFTAKIKPYAEWIGVIAIFVGLDSLLF